MIVSLSRLQELYPRVAVEVSSDGSVITVSGLPYVNGRRTGIKCATSYMVNKFGSGVVEFTGPLSTKAEEIIIKAVKMRFDVQEPHTSSSAMAGLPLHTPRSQQLLAESAKNAEKDAHRCKAQQPVPQSPSSTLVYAAFSGPMFGPGESSGNWAEDAEDTNPPPVPTPTPASALAPVLPHEEEEEEEDQQPPPILVYVKNRSRGPLDAMVVLAKSHGIDLVVVYSGPVFLLDVSLLLAKGILTIGVSALGNEVVCGVMTAGGTFKYGCISNVDQTSYPALLAMFPEKARTLEQVVQSRFANKVVKPSPRAGLLPVPSCLQYCPCQAMGSFPVPVPVPVYYTPVYDEWGLFIVRWRVVPLA